MSALATPLARRPVNRRWLLAAPAVLFLLVFFAAPLAQNAMRSLDVVIDPALGGGMFQNYWKLLVDPYYRGVVIETIKVSAWTTVMCLVIGYPIAYFMVRRAGRLAMPMIFLLIAPLLTSIIMRTFGWRVLFARRGPVNDLLEWLHIIERPLKLLDGYFAVYVGTVHITVPFMVLSIIPVLRAVDQRLEESSRVLGAGALRTFWRITLPLSVEGMITGSILVFMLTSGSFVTQLLLGGGQVVTLPLLIFQQFSLTQNLGFAAAMGNVLLIVVLACLFIQMRVSDAGARRPA
jgi:putative spermidine/putrescine transport system permease protein